MPEQPGWYPDPAKADAARWWDGRSWTSHVRAATPPPAPVATEAQRAVPGWEPPRAHHYRLPGPDNWLTRNVVSLMSLLMAVVYLMVIVRGGFFIFGLFPLSLAIFGYKQHERLAVPALLVAALTIVANFAGMNS